MTTILSNTSELSNPLNSTLSRFSHVKAINAGYRAQCPSCAAQGKDKGKNNLFIGNGFCTNNLPKLAVYCHAGCNAESILSAVGLGFKDLYTPSISFKPEKFSVLKERLEYYKLAKAIALPENDYTVLHSALEPAIITTTQAEFIKAFEDATYSRESFFIQSPLGSGKTEHAHAVAAIRAIHGKSNVVFVSFLRSVIAQNTTALNNVFNDDEANNKAVLHYNAKKEERATNEEIGAICTTVQGLLKDWIADYREHGHDNSTVKLPPILIIDEFTQFAQALSIKNGIIKGTERTAIINALFDFRARGGQIIALDGNITPNSGFLAQQLGLTIVKNTWTPFPAPSYTIYENTDGGTPYLNFILKSLNNNETVTVACSTLKTTETLSKQLAEYAPDKRILLLNSTNTSKEKERAFLENPEDLMNEYDCIIYSPVLSAGFSVKHTKVRAFAVINEAPSARLCPTVIEQLTRRFRNLHDNTITMFFKPNFSGNKITELEANVYAEQLNNDLDKNWINDLKNDTQTAAHISVTLNSLDVKREALISFNYLEAIKGSLAAAGYKVTSESLEQNKKEASLQKAKLRELNDELKQAEVQRVATARLISTEEARYLQSLDESETVENRALLTRKRIENSLVLTEDDYEGNGELNAELVEECLTNNFEAKIKRSIITVADSLNIPTVAINDDTNVSIIDRQHIDEQSIIFKKILSQALDYDGEKAIDIINSVKDDIVAIRHDLLKTTPLLPTEHLNPVADSYRKGLATKEEFEASYSAEQRTQDKRVAVKWLNSLLEMWGFDIKDKRVQVNKKRVRVYSPTINTEVLNYTLRRINKIIERAVYSEILGKEEAQTMRESLGMTAQAA